MGALVAAVATDGKLRILELDGETGTVRFARSPPAVFRCAASSTTGGFSSASRPANWRCSTWTRNGSSFGVSSSTTPSTPWRSARVADRLAVAFRSSRIQILDAESGETVQALEGHRDSVYDLEWLRETALVSGGKDKRILLWDLEASEFSVFTGEGRASLDLKTMASDIPCQAACPAGTNVPEYIHQLVLKSQTPPTRINQEDNVFPGVLGRVCTRPCEPACRHQWTNTNGPVTICHLKRGAADNKSQPAQPLPPWFDEITGKRVAVIGGGPAGLTAARELWRLGHAVDLFEREAVLGGQMAWGIPGFRLPRDVVRQEGAGHRRQRHPGAPRRTRRPRVANAASHGVRRAARRSR